MSEEAILAIIQQHLFSYQGHCECGVYVGTNPDHIAKNLARKIYEASIS